MKYITTVKDLKVLFAKMKNYESDEDNRPLLRGIHVTSFEGKAYAYATNGYRVAKMLLDGEIIDADNEGMKVPIVKLPSAKGEVVIEKTDSGVVFNFPNGTLVAKSSHEFPDAESILNLPEESSWIGMHADNFAKSLASFVNKGRYTNDNAVKITFEMGSDGKIKRNKPVWIENKDKSMVALVMPANFPSKEWE